MTEKEFEKVTKSIQDKLGKENTSLIKNICFKNILINGKKCQFDDLNLHIGNNVTKVDCI